MRNNFLIDYSFPTLFPQNAITHIFEMAAGPVRELFGRGQISKTQDNSVTELYDNSETTYEDIILVHPVHGKGA